MDDVTLDAITYGRRRGLSNAMLSRITGISVMLLGRAFKRHDVPANLEAKLHLNPVERNSVISQVEKILSGEVTSEDLYIMRGYAYVYYNKKIKNDVYVRADGVSLPYVTGIYTLPRVVNGIV